MNIQAKILEIFEKFILVYSDIFFSLNKLDFKINSN